MRARTAATVERPAGQRAGALRRSSLLRRAPLEDLQRLAGNRAVTTLVVQREDGDGAAGGGHRLGGFSVPLSDPQSDRELLNELRARRLRQPVALAARPFAPSRRDEVSAHLTERSRAAAAPWPEFLAARRAREQLIGLLEQARVEVPRELVALREGQPVPAPLAASCVALVARSRLLDQAPIRVNDGSSPAQSVAAAVTEMWRRTYQKDCKDREARRPDLKRLKDQAGELLVQGCPASQVIDRCARIEAAAADFASRPWPPKAPPASGASPTAGLPDDHVFVDPSATGEAEALEWISRRCRRAIADNSAKTAYRDALRQAGGGTGLVFDGHTVFHHSSGARNSDSGCTLFVVRRGTGVQIVGIGWHDHTRAAGANARYRLDWKDPSWSQPTVITI